MLPPKIPMQPIIPATRERTREEKAKYFWSKVNIQGPDECWYFKSCKHTQEYGIFGFDKRHKHAHRVAWMLTNGSVPEGLCVAHLCRTPACCNPKHLVAATYKENSAHLIQHKKEGRKRIFKKL